MKIALFPGSFDPVTKAHVDIIKRSVDLFDKLYIGIGDNSSKKGLLTVAQRENMLRAVFENDPRIHVVSYDGLTINFARSIGAARGTCVDETNDPPRGGLVSDLHFRP